MLTHRTTSTGLPPASTPSSAPAAPARRSRRTTRGITVAVASVAVLLTSACGSGSAPAQPGATGSAGGTAGTATASGETGGTRTITDTYLGTVTGVPTHPQRVVALWRTGAELVDLGVKPVGQLEGELAENELGEAFVAVKDTPAVGTTDGVDVEKVIALDPDLIVGMDHGGLGIKYDELKEVAPTVILKIAEPTDVWDNYPKLADVVGLKTDFASKDAALTAELKTIADEHGDALKALQVTSIGKAYEGNTLYIDTSKSLTHRRLTAAGFGYNPTYTKNPARYVTELSPENLPSLANQDVIFFEANADGTPVANLAPTLKLESFTRLPAVKAGHVFPLSSGTIYTFDAARLQARDLAAAADALAEKG